MATEAVDIRAWRSAGAGAIGRTVDRWIYVFMAVLYFLTVLVGFVPDFLRKIPLIRAGRHAPLAPIWDLHAVAMGSFVTLFVVQTVLMAGLLRGSVQEPPAAAADGKTASCEAEA